MMISNFKINRGNVKQAPSKMHYITLHYIHVFALEVSFDAKEPLRGGSGEVG